MPKEKTTRKAKAAKVDTKKKKEKGKSLGSLASCSTLTKFPRSQRAKARAVGVHVLCQ